MPKQKTHKGISKRMKITASGKVKHRNSCGGHLLSKKNAKRKRRIAGCDYLDPVLAKKVKTRLS